MVLVNVKYPYWPGVDSVTVTLDPLGVIVPVESTTLYRVSAQEYGSVEPTDQRGWCTCQSMGVLYVRK